MIPHAVAQSPTLQVGAELGIRLLALVITARGDEHYRVSSQTSATGPFVAGTLTHAHGAGWDLVLEGATAPTRVALGSPDEVFTLALNGDATADRAAVLGAAPRWPAAILDRLARRRLSGPGTVAIDARWFLAELATSTFDHPLLLPDATAKLGLTGLERAAAILRAAGASPSFELAELLLRALHAPPPRDRALAWSGDGRLIGELHDGELAQLGADLDEGCRAALGTGPLTVVFAPTEPLGLGLGPLWPTDAEDPLAADSAGAGCVVGEVDPRSAADRAGVKAGMALSHLANPRLDLPSRGPDALSFEAVLAAIDSRRAAGGPLAITFDTVAPVTHRYAVELPAAAALRALAATVDAHLQVPSRDAGVGASLDALCGRTLVWREPTPRLFWGEAGSLTCAHTDLCPQVQMAHALVGTKLLGVASHPATPRLSAEHAPRDAAGDGEIIEHDATSVATDRPLTRRATRLLRDPALTIGALRPGDLAVFHSGALHFASNAADGLGGALYHGLITPGAVPRLRLAAARAEAPTAGAYSGHLFAPELLRVVERRLAGDRRGARGAGRSGAGAGAE